MTGAPRAVADVDGARPRARPVRVLAGLALACVVATVVLALWISSIPSGAPFAYALVALVLCGTSLALLVALLVALLIATIARRRMSWLLAGSVALLVGGLAVASTPLPAAAHWPAIRTDLEKAWQSGQCPNRAGLVVVERCITVAGTTGFDFGSGFLNTVVVAKLDQAALAELDRRAVADPTADGWRVQLNESLGDGWQVLVFEW